MTREKCNAKFLDKTRVIWVSSGQALNRFGDVEVTSYEEVAKAFDEQEEKYMDKLESANNTLTDMQLMLNRLRGECLRNIELIDELSNKLYNPI